MSVYDKAREKRIGAPEWKKQLGKELLRSKRNRFPRRSVYIKKPDDTWTADIMDIHKYARVNKGYKYILVVVDIFSRFAWAKPLKTKSGLEVSNAFKEIFQTWHRRPDKLWTDKGTEFWNQNVRHVLHGAAFYNHSVNQMLHANNIKLYSTFNEPKAMIAERFIRTLRGKIESNFILTQSTVWYDVLPQLIHEYNNTRHSSINMSPEKACKSENLLKVYRMQFKMNKNNLGRCQKIVYNVGDRVRISVQKQIFEKGATPNWTEEIFEISHINSHTRPITYKLKDLVGEQLNGAFYSQQLLKTNQEIYRIERILRRRQAPDGTREAFVKWSGYPNKFNEWIPINNIHLGGRDI